MNKETKDPLDEIFTKNITIKEFKDMEEQINEYRRLYVSAVLIREKDIIKIMKERQDLLDLTIKLNRRIEELNTALSTLSESQGGKAK